MKRCVDTRVYVPAIMRQSVRSIADLIAVTSLAACLTGCASIHLSDMWGTKPESTGAVDSMTPEVAAGSITGSVAQPGSLSYAGSDHSDWDLVRSTVSASLSAPATARIEWANRTTGSSGTITELTSTGMAGGHDCHSFTTTIVAIDGVRLYRAEICKSIMSTWEFSKIAAADSQ